MFDDEVLLQEIGFSKNKSFAFIRSIHPPEPIEFFEDFRNAVFSFRGKMWKSIVSTKNFYRTNRDRNNYKQNDGESVINTMNDCVENTTT